MITVEQIIENNEAVKNMAAGYALKIARGNYSVEELTKDLIDVASEVLYRKLNGRPAIIDTCSGRVERNKGFAQQVYDIVDATPLVGMACTEILYSDKYACEVVEVVSPKKIIVRQKAYKQKDCYEGECIVLDEWYREDDQMTFTLRKGGCWVMKGQPNKFGSVVLALGFARTYVDPSF